LNSRAHVPKSDAIAARLEVFRVSVSSMNIAFATYKLTPSQSDRRMNQQMEAVPPSGSL
jgi:hypothetical protein